eukprot:tig00021073_g18042.t1
MVQGKFKKAAQPIRQKSVHAQAPVKKTIRKSKQPEDSIGKKLTSAITRRIEGEMASRCKADNTPLATVKPAAQDTPADAGKKKGAAKKKGMAKTK